MNRKDAMMRTTVLGIGLAGLMGAVLFTVLPVDAAEEANRDKEVIAIVYPIADLPVWTHGGESKLDPRLLIAYLKAAISPSSWERGLIRKHETTHSLVIHQTRANHRKIQRFLSTLRPDVPNENLGI